MNTFDLIIIGAGSAGLATARRASANNQKVLLIEQQKIGGTCVNVGCIPKKITYNLAHIISNIELGKDYGIELSSNLEINYGYFAKKRDDFVSKLNKIYENIIEGTSIKYVTGRAELHMNCVKVNDETYFYKKVILCTGSKPIQLSEKNLDVLCSDDFFNLKEIPKTCVLIGSGYIAVEIAFMLKELGSDVHVICRGDKVLSYFDESIQRNVEEAMKRKKINLYFNTKVKQINGKKVILVNKDGNDVIEVESDFTMAAIGRDCDLSYIKVPIKSKDNFLIVDNDFKTSIKNVYAIGDLIGPKFMLTPVAIYCGRILADHLSKKENDGDFVDLVGKYKIFDSIPTVVFSHPPSATIGLTEKEAREKYKEIEVKKTTFNNLFYSHTDDKQKSEFKLILNDGYVVGMHLFGMGSDEIVQGFAIPMKMGIKYVDWKVVGVHPTAGEEVVTMK